MAEPIWFAEPPIAGFEQRLAVRADRRQERSQFQELRVLDTEPFGVTLILDGAVQTTEVDEAAYHEMLVHVPLLAHPSPRDVLIIGGGDGGTLRRVLEHPVERVLEVEIDESVIRASRELLPSISAGAFDDPRAEVIVGDGVSFLAEHESAFDVIVIDSTDPVGPAEALFSIPFYQSVRRALRPGGIVTSHCGSPMLMADGWNATISALERVFEVVEPYLTYVPSYPGGLWGMVAASTSRSSREPLIDRLECFGDALERLTYYTPRVHQASFALPATLERRQPLFPGLGSSLAATRR
jgi:spermidine synthase